MATCKPSLDDYPEGISFISELSIEELNEFCNKFNLPVEEITSEEALRHLITGYIIESRNKKDDKSPSHSSHESSEDSDREKKNKEDENKDGRNRDRRDRKEDDRERRERDKEERERERDKEEREEKDRRRRERRLYRQRKYRKRYDDDSSTDEDSVSGTLYEILREMQMNRKDSSKPTRESLARELARWDVTFKGEDTESVDHFIEQIVQFKEAKNIKGKLMLSMMPELLKGKARSWFFLNIAELTTWEIFLEKLKESYRKAGYESKLFRDMMVRTQGTLEPIEQYVTVIRSMNNRLASQLKLNENSLVSLIIDNLNPFFVKQIGVSKFSSFSDLLRWGRAIEANYAKAKMYKQPPSPSQVVDPEFGFKSTTESNRNNNYNGKPYDQRNSQQPARPPQRKDNKDNSSALDSKQGSAGVGCWNCGDTSHRFSSCKKPKLKFCHLCGRKDVTIKECCRKQKEN
jgi:hypothetical protein